MATRYPRKAERGVADTKRLDSEAGIDVFRETLVPALSPTKLLELLSARTGLQAASSTTGFESAATTAVTRENGLDSSGLGN
jgi:hypothetical protein